VEHHSVASDLRILFDSVRAVRGCKIADWPVMPDFYQHRQPLFSGVCCHAARHCVGGNAQEAGLMEIHGFRQGSTYPTGLNN